MYVIGEREKEREVETQCLEKRKFRKSEGFLMDEKGRGGEVIFFPFIRLGWGALMRDAGTYSTQSIQNRSWKPASKRPSLSLYIPEQT